MDTTTTTSSSSSGSGSSTASTSDSNPYQVNIKIMIAAIVVLFAVILFILSLHLYAKWFWKSSQFATRRRRRLLHLQQIHAIQQQIQAATLAAAESSSPDSRDTPLLFFTNSPALGVDKSIIQTLPLFVFDKTTKIDCCAVCLCEFQDGEQGRTLPKCGHSFHTECIDMWLQCHSTCPLCRASLMDSTGIAGFSKSVPELLLLPDLQLVTTTLSAASPVDSVSAAEALPSSSSFASSSSSPSSDADSQLHQHQLQLVLDLDDTFKSSSSSSSAAAASLSAKSRWRNLRRMLARLSSSSPGSLPASSSCSFSSTSSAASSYAV